MSLMVNKTTSRYLALHVLLVLLCATLKADEPPNPSCVNGTGSGQSTVDGFTVAIGPSSAEPQKPCEAKVINKSGRFVFRTGDYAVKLEAVGVANTSAPSVMFESFSGGAHCCYTYSIVGLGNKPGLIKKVTNQVPLVVITDEKSGKATLKGRDGGFDYFEVPHVYAPMPLVFLRVQKGILRNVGPEFIDEYNAEIQSIRSKLTPEAVDKLRTDPASEDPQVMETRGRVIRATLDYLYSGQEKKGWEFLQESWSAADLPRVRKKIEERRKKGILGQAAVSATHPTPANRKI